TVRWRATRARYYATHRDKMRAINTQYYVDHREEILARQRSEEVRIVHAERYARNRDDIRAKQAVYRREHQEEHQARTTDYQHRQRANGGSFTLAEWEVKQVMFDFRCAYCGQEAKLTRDHIIPLSEGGTHDYSNIVPACQSCNSRKGRRIVDIGAYCGS
ncbi:hypothetical protein LCGC14_2097730, partial [marine sediment metagenome]